MKVWFRKSLVLLLAILVLVSGFPFANQLKAEAAGVVDTVKDSTYLSLKYDNFLPSHPLKDQIQYNSNVVKPDLGWIEESGQGKLRLAGQYNTTGGSAFNKERISLSNDRSFSTYFNFQMKRTISGGRAADGIVFVVQTASNAAGSTGGGLGYEEVGRSIGIEYDTYYNPEKNDPLAIGGDDKIASHIAYDKNGIVTHPDASNVAGKAERNEILANLKSSDMDLSNGVYHSWIEYDGVADKLRVYLIKEEANGKYLVPIMGPGTNEKEQDTTVTIQGFPTLGTSKGLVGVRASDSASIDIKPVLDISGVDLSSILTQDEAYVGFTASTGGMNQNHDLLKWYFNNDSGLIVPNSGGTNIEQAPTKIKILNKEAFEYQTPYQGKDHQGIKVNEAKASVTAQVYTAENEMIKGYPVTFSLYLVDGIVNVPIGTGAPVRTEVRKDDPEILMKALGYTRVKKSFVHSSDDETQEVWEITVPTDENGQASIDLYNLGIPHLTNVKARIGGDLKGYSAPHGGGRYDEAPVLFGAEEPKVVKSEVSDDRRKVIADFDIPVKYDPTKPGGFWLEIPGSDPIPLIIEDYVITNGDKDPFKLVLKLDPDKVSPNTIIPPNVVPVLHYDGDPKDPTTPGSGSVTDRSGEKTLKNFPDGNGTPISVINRFAPESQTVVNDAGRNTIKVTFPNKLVNPDLGVKAAFEVVINDGKNPPVKVGVTNVVKDSSDGKILDLTIDPNNLNSAWEGKIPADAVVSLSYDPAKLPAGVTGIKREPILGETNENLDRFIHPVVNQIEPLSANVINDEARNKITVKLPSALKQPANNIKTAFKIFSDGKPISVDSVVWDPLHPDVLVLALDQQDLNTVFKDGKIPYEVSGSPTLTLEYNPAQTGTTPIVDIHNQQLRALGSAVYTGDYAINNQTAFEPTSATVNDDNRKQVIVKFPNKKIISGQPELQIVVGGDFNNPIDVTDIGGSGSDTFILTLDTKVDYNKEVQLIYKPSVNGSIVDQVNPNGNVLRPLGPTTADSKDYPVQNQFGPNKAVVIEDNGGRNKVELTFPSAITNPQSVPPGSFTVVITPDIAHPEISVTATVYHLDWNGTSPSKLVLKFDPTDLANRGLTNGIPPEADVKLNYTPPGANPVTTGTQNLGKLVLFPVENGDYDNAKLKLTASPDSILGDGQSFSTLTAKVTKQNGDPVANTKVVFNVPPSQSGYFVDPITSAHVTSIEVLTNGNGIATIPYYSEKIIGTNEVAITVTAKVRDHVLKLKAEDDITVTFAPATVSGVVIHEGVKVAGAIVKITDPATGWTKSFTTTADDNVGSYRFVVPEGDKQYKIEVTIPIQSSGQSVPVKFTQNVNVGTVTGAGSQEFPSTQTVTGLVGLNLPVNGESRWFGNSAVSNLKVKLKDSTGAYLHNDAINQDWFLLEGTGTGIFTADNLITNKDYQMEVWYQMEIYDKNGPTGVFKEILINGKPDPLDPSKIKYPVIKVTESGELNIVQDLVDPYGTVMNGSDGNKPIPGAKVTLYYWGTTNEVYLPPIAGFEPNDNASPTQYTDVLGNYAYMVYPNTDYEVVVEAPGFPRYSSGKISVGTDIVRHDVVLYAFSNNGPYIPAIPPVTPPTEGKPNLTVNLTTSSSQYEEESTGTIVVDYSNNGNLLLKSGEISITIPAGAEVIDADGGKVSGNTITWLVKDLGINQQGSYKVKLKFPKANAAEKIVQVTAQAKSADGEWANPEYAKSSLKLLIFSNRYGDVEHIRYILGYPDAKFKPKNTLSRAELAAIVARLINGGNTNDKANYSDVPSKHWASGYIRIVTDNKIFTGFNDGTFRPEAPVTREELAVVMLRFLEIDGSNPIKPQFEDVKGRWSAAAIEALYRNGLINGYPDGTFKPGSNIIRSEAVSLINKMLFRGPLTNVTPSFPDVSSSHWAFGQVEEASHSHKATRKENGSEVFVKTLDDTVK
ncbi:S-layer homology domain-containing protein [Cohnella abietis]|uniref:S-layer homology domain-containing protein n=1 Tax=Cohnella abietis TaxID=2507935 RepID=A0A3T1CYN3_9BACL|nr:S-layer homology domain-containing protein [Cohnella abietis]BBI30946.1 hypothetical protein KCTCHS21_03450 [Cohnella abietis]